MRIILILLLLFPLTSIATTYYLDSINGNDDNTGDSVFSPWKTTRRINKQQFKPGDQLLFHRGNIWEDALIEVKVSDFSIGAYGVGHAPVLIGSIKVRNWRKAPGAPGVYYTYVQRPSEHHNSKSWEVQLVLEDDHLFYRREDNTINPARLKQGSFTYKKDRQQLYIRPYSNNINKKQLYVGQHENIIQINHARINSLQIEDLEISLANRYGIGPWWQGDKLRQGNILVRNILFYGNAFSAVCLSGGMTYDNIVIHNNIIRNNGAEGIYIGKKIALQSLKITNNQIGLPQDDNFGWRGEGENSAFNGDGIDVKQGNRNVLIAGNGIINLNGYCGICYNSGDSIIENNTIENIYMPNGLWPAGIITDINDNYNTSIIRNNNIKGSLMHGINIRGKANIAPPIRITNNIIDIAPNSIFSQIIFSARNTANVTIDNNTGDGGNYAVKLTGMSPHNIHIRHNNFGHINTPWYMSSNRLDGFYASNNIICSGSQQYLEWINGTKEKNLRTANNYLGNDRATIETSCR